MSQLPGGVRGVCGHVVQIELRLLCSHFLGVSKVNSLYITVLGGFGFLFSFPKELLFEPCLKLDVNSVQCCWE